MQKNISKVEQAFFDLLRAGLWEERSLPLNAYRLPESADKIDWSQVLDLAEEQSVVGLLTAGIERFKVQDSSQCEAAKPSARFKVPKPIALQFVGRVTQLEQRNQAMNYFIGVMVEKMREVGIYTLLVKGQGMAQCYERPLWRACGDVDFFLDDENYERAKAFLRPLAASVEEEYVREKHLGMTIDPWVVELHGRLYSGLSARIERELDAVLRETFEGGKVRIWKDGETEVPLLAVENDVVYVFAHMLQHFYKEGLGLKQVCDWCRLLYRYRSELDLRLLESRIKRMGLMSEWKAFGALAIEYLGFPKDSMPLLDVRSKKEDVRWKKKADRIMEFILKSGNMGHNRGSWLMEHDSWLTRQYVVRKAFSMFRRIGDLINHARIFPLDSLRFFPRIMFNGVRSAIRGE